MRTRVGARSDIGRARQRNEDSFLVREPLFAVADGMGGHRGGDVASSLALEHIEGEGPAEHDFRQLVESIKRANRRVLERGEADRNLRGMGTTLTAVVAGDGKARVAHVGDSRAYLLREGALQQLTEDHTLVQRLVREGKLSEDEAAHHPQRSIVTRALGVEDAIDVDELTLDVLPGDRLLICTDGLTNMVDRPRLQEILGGEPDPQAACDRLIEEANRAGGDDNITVIVIDFLQDGSAGGERASAGATSPGEQRSGGDDEHEGLRGGAASPAGEDATEATRSYPGFADERPGRGPSRTIRWRRAALWAGAAAVVVVAALIAGRIYLSHQWYVGEADGRVAIYNGIPTEVLGLHLSHVEQLTEVSAPNAERLQPWRGLGDGITASSFQGAVAIVEQIRQDLHPPGGA